MGQRGSKAGAGAAEGTCACTADFFQEGGQTRHGGGSPGRPSTSEPIPLGQLRAAAAAALASAAPVQQLGDLIAEGAHNQQEQLLGLERQLGDHLYSAYRGQVEQLAPTLHLRGEMLGEALLDYFTGRSAATSTYGDVQAASLADPRTQRREPLALEALRAADPLLTPVLDPFVEGVKQPIIRAVGTIERQVKRDVVLGVAAIGLACGLAGFAAGRSHAARDRRRKPD